MTAQWQDTPLSVIDDNGSRVGTLSQGITPAKVEFNAQQAISGATAELFRIKHDYELKRPSDDPWEPIAVGEAAFTGAIVGTVATFSITGHVRHEAYILVVTYTATVGEPFTRTRKYDCVA